MVLILLLLLLPQAHPKFENVAQLAPLLFSQALQTSEAKQPQALALGEAVAQKIIANETLGYFIGRTFLFLVRLPCPFPTFDRRRESCAHGVGLMPCIQFCSWKLIVLEHLFTLWRHAQWLGCSLSFWRAL